MKPTFLSCAFFRYPLAPAVRRLALVSIVIPILLLITPWLAIGCSPTNETPDTTAITTTKTPTGTAQVSTGAQYSIQVFLNDIQIGSLTIDKLSKLAKVSFTSEGKSEEGPSLTSALNLVGVKTFNEITVFGYSKGRVATAQITLQKSQVNDKVILDFSNQGTAKLASPDIALNNWIIDITKIVVK